MTGVSSQQGLGLLSSVRCGGPSVVLVDEDMLWCLLLKKKSIVGKGQESHDQVGMGQPIRKEKGT